jgi:hypothetical protein
LKKNKSSRKQRNACQGLFWTGLASKWRIAAESFTFRVLWSGSARIATKLFGVSSAPSDAPAVV